MKKVSFFIISLLLILTSSALSADEKTNKKEIPDLSGFVGYVPNEIVVKFDPSITAKKDKKGAAKGKLGISSLDQVGSRHNVISILPQFPKAKKKKYKGREIDLSGWHKIKFGRKVDVKAVVKEYKKIPGVIDAQPIGIHSLYASYPNDPFFYLYSDTYWNQWYLDQKVEKRCDPNVDADIDAPEAWVTVTGDDTVVVAVLDTGVRYFHRDLGGSDASYYNPGDTIGNMWINLEEKDGVSDQDDDNNNYTDDWIGYDFVTEAPEDTCGYILGIPICPCTNGEDCGGTDNDPRDFNGHGTHVAGIVAAMNNNGYGTASTAGGWGNSAPQSIGNGVKIMPLRICWSADYFMSGEVGLCRMDFAAEALYYAADNGAHFVNASWGSGNEGGIAEAIDYYLASGGIIVVAAGNSNSETADYIPSRNDPGIISVAATDCADCKAVFESGAGTNFGTWVDVSAPGKNILSSFHDHTAPQSDYVRFMSGTSMATPLALGVAALIWSEYPTLTACQVEQRLKESSDDIYGLGCNSSYIDKLGAGRVNAFNAVNIDCSSDDGDYDAFSPCDGDCDDGDGSINPEAAETCDGLDNDCDCFVDEGFPKNVSHGTLSCNSGVPDLSCDANFFDCDGDLENGCESDISCSLDIDNDGDGYTENEGDCDDSNDSIYPDAAEECDGLDNDCDQIVPADEADADTDGFRICAGDCNDTAADINPGAAEVCDGLDNNCNGSTDEGVATTYYQDSDGDGYGNAAVTQQACSPTPPSGYVSNSSDCNDNDAAEHPGQTWYLDADGDGYSDGTTNTASCTRPADYFIASELTATSGDCNDTAADINPGAAEVCDGLDNNCNGSTDEGVATTYYQDSDGDGYGNAAVTQQACSPTPPSGYVSNSSDCNDNDAAEHPGQTWYLDADGDGYSDGTTNTASCTRPADYFIASELTATSGDCNDTAADINPGAAEVCDGLDNNCNGSTDEGVATTYYQDSDGDGYGNAAVTQQACSPTPPSGYVSNSSDCNDNDAAEHSGQTWYLDADGDGYSDGTTNTASCTRPADYFIASELTATSGDCNDTAADINPGAAEVCDGLDNNCNGSTDEGLSCDAYCGNDVCDDGEDCSSCPNDCIGKTTGKPSSRYCCGDGACEEAENASNCAIDCGPAPNCGDGTCDPDEDQCSCAVDCGAPSSTENLCNDGIDNDCDTTLDCDDSDCSGDPDCGPAPYCGDGTCDPDEDFITCSDDCSNDCLPKGSVCATNDVCCSNNCRGKKCK